MDYAVLCNQLCSASYGSCSLTFHFKHLLNEVCVVPRARDNGSNNMFFFFTRIERLTENFGIRMMILKKWFLVSAQKLRCCHSALRFITGDADITHHCILSENVGWTSESHSLVFLSFTSLLVWTL